jgi:hypothetical protein
MAAPVLHQTPFPAGDQRVLLFARGITVVPQAARPGTTEVTRLPACLHSRTRPDAA